VFLSERGLRARLARSAGSRLRGRRPQWTRAQDFDKDPQKAQRVMQAMTQTKKIDIAP
jgi:hypothetical protein